MQDRDIKKRQAVACGVINYSAFRPALFMSSYHMAKLCLDRPKHEYSFDAVKNWYCEDKFLKKWNVRIYDYTNGLWLLLRVQILIVLPQISYNDLVNSSKLIIFPVNCGRMHWILLVIDISNHVVRIYDSLKVCIT